MYTSNMVYSSTNIEIVLIKKDKVVRDDTSPDDYISIRKNLDLNEFELTFKEKSGDTMKNIVHLTKGMYHNKVMDYIHLLFKNQYLDDEPYTHIQVNIPAMPRIIISGDKFNDVYYREHVCELISMGLDLLGDTASVPTKKNVPLMSIYDYVYPSYTEYPLPSPRSTSPGVLPQHLFWDE
jgi:hypothetical protein